MAEPRRLACAVDVLSHDDHRGPGTNGRTPVLMLHGAVQTRRIWDAQVAVLGTQRRVIVPDFRGHGSTPLGTRPLSVEGMADDALALLDELSIDKAVVCGVSLGGMVALEMTERAPERIEALVLANTPRALTSVRWIRRLVAWAAPQRLLWPVFGVLGQDRSARVGLAIARLVVGPLWVGRTARAHFIAGFSKMKPEAIVGVYRAIVECSPVDLRRVRCPCLLIEGRHDAGAIRRQGAEIDDEAVNAHAEVLDAGHVANLDDPDGFNRLLVRFLNNLERGISDAAKQA